MSVCEGSPNTGAQPRGIPKWVPECYKNEMLTSDFIMEKIKAVTPQGHFGILRDRDFFKEDRMGVQKYFYDVP